MGVGYIYASMAISITLGSSARGLLTGVLRERNSVMLGLTQRHNGHATVALLPGLANAVFS